MDRPADAGRWLLHFDGGCVNRRSATYGWTLTAPGGATCAAGHAALPGPPATLTNNVAEFAGLAAALAYVLREQAAGRLCDVDLDVRGDSALVVHCAAGRWKCRKPHLKILCDRVRAALAALRCRWTLTWVPRAANAAADRLACAAAGRKPKKKSAGKGGRKKPGWWRHGRGWPDGAGGFGL